MRNSSHISTHTHTHVSCAADLRRGNGPNIKVCFCIALASCTVNKHSYISQICACVQHYYNHLTCPDRITRPKQNECSTTMALPVGRLLCGLRGEGQLCGLRGGMVLWGPRGGEKNWNFGGRAMYLRELSRDAYRVAGIHNISQKPISTSGQDRRTASVSKVMAW